MLGRVCHTQGRLENGEAELRKALTLAPGMQEVHVSLGVVLIAQERFEEAVIALQRAVELDPISGAAQYNLSVAYARQGRHADAIRAARKAFCSWPSVLTGQHLALSAPNKTRL